MKSGQTQDRNLTHFTVSLPPGLLERATGLAEKRGITAREWIQQQVVNAIVSQSEPKPFAGDRFRHTARSGEETHYE